ncbi:hypothetical protein HK405_009426 [Cladochytrium tenue]|nr:hypothetical protein HK405_009426 [Cladochytrium tenue]
MPIVGKPLPHITGLKFVQGPEVEVGGPQAGPPQITVVEFWATWCPPCVRSIPHLSDLYQRYSRECNLRVVGITNERNQDAKIARFVADRGTSMAYPVAIDEENSASNLIMRAAGATGIPYCVVAGADGIIVWEGHPMDPAFEKQLQNLVKSAPLAPQEALPPITLSFDELMQLPVKDLKGMLKDRKIDFGDCVEKSDLARRVVERASA